MQCESEQNSPHPYSTDCLNSGEIVQRAISQTLKISYRLIAATGVRNFGIASAYAKGKGIVVSGTERGGNPTLEHIWALFLATVRYITVEDANMKAGVPQWQSTMPLGLAGLLWALWVWEDWER